MDFLSLCQRLRQEARIAGTGPSSTTDQTGEAARIVTWTNNAWLDIQRASNQWLWMRDEFSAPLVTGQTEYSPGDLNITTTVRDWDRYSFTIYGQANGVGDETDICYLPWSVWRREYQLGTQNDSRPIHWTFKPNRNIAVGPRPEKVYVLKGEYQKTATDLANDGAIPDMPEEFHLLIVWWALGKYAASEAAPEVFAYAEAERVRLLAELRLNQLPDIMLEGPLA